MIEKKGHRLGREEKKKASKVHVYIGKMSLKHL